MDGLVKLPSEPLGDWVHLDGAGLGVAATGGDGPLRIELPWGWTRLETFVPLLDLSVAAFESRRVNIEAVEDVREEGAENLSELEVGRLDRTRVILSL